MIVDKCTICNEKIWFWQSSTYTIKKLENGDFIKFNTRHYNCYKKQLDDKIREELK